MISVLETKEYTAKKAALLVVLKELKFLVKDIDEFIENYADVRIACCNSLLGTQYSTNCRFMHQDIADKVVAKYIVMCSDPFDIVDLYKADYMKSVVETKDAVITKDTEVPKDITGEEITSKQVDYALLERVRSAIVTDCPEYTYGISSIAAFKVFSYLNIECKSSLSGTFYPVSNPQYDYICQCGHVSCTSNNGVCHVCGSKTDMLSYATSKFHDLIIECKTPAELASKFIAGLSCVPAYSMMHEDAVSEIMHILRLNKHYSFNQEDFNTLARHIVQIASADKSDIILPGVSILYEMRSADARSVNDLLKAAGIKEYYCNKDKSNIYRIIRQ